MARMWMSGRASRRGMESLRLAVWLVARSSGGPLSGARRLRSDRTGISPPMDGVPPGVKGVRQRTFCVGASGLCLLGSGGDARGGGGDVATRRGDALGCESARRRPHEGYGQILSASRREGRLPIPRRRRSTGDSLGSCQGDVGSEVRLCGCRKGRSPG